MLTYFKVEFYTGFEGVGPFIHVVSKDPSEAVAVAKAERVEQGNLDLRIEHVWEEMAPETLAKMRPSLNSGEARVVADPNSMA